MLQNVYTTAHDIKKINNNLNMEYNNIKVKTDKFRYRNISYSSKKIRPNKNIITVVAIMHQTAMLIIWYYACIILHF